MHFLSLVTVDILRQITQFCGRYVLCLGFLNFPDQCPIPALMIQTVSRHFQYSLKACLTSPPVEKRWYTKTKPDHHCNPITLTNRRGILLKYKWVNSWIHSILNVINTLNNCIVQYKLSLILK